MPPRYRLRSHTIAEMHVHHLEPMAPAIGGNVQDAVQIAVPNNDVAQPAPDIQQGEFENIQDSTDSPFQTLSRGETNSPLTELSPSSVPLDMDGRVDNDLEHGDTEGTTEETPPPRHAVELAPSPPEVTSGLSRVAAAHDRLGAVEVPVGSPSSINAEDGSNAGSREYMDDNQLTITRNNVVKGLTARKTAAADRMDDSDEGERDGFASPRRVARSPSPPIVERPSGPMYFTDSLSNDIDLEEHDSHAEVESASMMQTVPEHDNDRTYAHSTSVRRSPLPARWLNNNEFMQRLFDSMTSEEIERYVLRNEIVRDRIAAARTDSSQSSNASSDDDEENPFIERQSNTSGRFCLLGANIGTPALDDNHRQHVRTTASPSASSGGRKERRFTTAEKAKMRAVDKEDDGDAPRGADNRAEVRNESDDEFEETRRTQIAADARITARLEAEEEDLLRTMKKLQMQKQELQQRHIDRETMIHTEERQHASHVKEEHSRSAKPTSPKNTVPRPSSQLPPNTFVGRVLRVGLRTASGASSDKDSEGGNNRLNDKPIPPFRYRGDANFDVFQRWVFEVIEYYNTCRLPASRQVPRIQRFLEGRAGHFFFQEVVKSRKKWTLESFLDALFNHCFPPNFKTQQRDRLTNSSQRGRPVRDWIIELQNLADSIGDVSERSLTLTFWRGADRYIRMRWAEAGFNPELATFDELQEAAERYEEAARYRELEQRFQTPQRRVQMSQNGNLFRPRGTGSRSEQLRVDAAHTPTPPSKNASKTRNNARFTLPKPRRELSNEEKNELRAQNRCFECRQEGHLGRDCPRRKIVTRASKSLTSASPVA